MNDNELLLDIDKRIALVESEQLRMIGARRIIWATAFTLLIYVVSSVFGYGKLVQKIDGLNLDSLKADVSTALTVAGQHGSELDLVRKEQARIREVVDGLRNEIDRKTHDRFFKPDGDKLELRILRLENKHFNKNHQDTE